MNLRAITAGVAISLAIGTMVPVAAHAESLKESLAAAYTSNPNILARRAFLRAVEEGVPIAESEWRPTVTFTADAGNGLYRSTTNNKWYSYQPRTVKLAVSQWLYRGGRTVAATKVADSTALSERANLFELEAQVLHDAAVAYLNTLRDQATLELNINNEQVLQRQLEAAEDRFRVGEITRTDVAQAEARLAGAVADRIQAQGTLEQTRASFKKQMGFDPVNLDTPEIVGDLPTSLDQANDLAAMYNFTIVSARNVAIAAQHNIDLVRGELWPSLRLDVTGQRKWEASAQSIWADSYAAVMTLTVPLYQAGNVYGRIREAKHTAGQRRIEVETNRRTAVESATAGWETLIAARARVKSFKSQIVAAEVALDGVEREAQVGSRTILDVLDAEQEVLNAKVSLVSAERDVMVAVFDLLQATGNLTAEKLGLPVKYFDAEKHYQQNHNNWIGSDAEADLDAGEGMPEDYYFVKGAHEQDAAAQTQTK